MLAALVLTVFLPAQQPASALDYLPADSVICLEASREPWERLGASTRLHAVLGLQGVQDCLAPTLELLASFDDEEGHGFGASLWNALAYSRMWVAVSVADLDDARPVMGIDLGPGAVLDLDGLFPEAHRRELAGGTLWRVPRVGAFWREGGVLIATASFSSGLDASLSDEEYLEGLVHGARAGGGGLAALPGMRRLRAELAGGDDLIGVWVPGEALDLDRWRALVPEVDRQETETILGVLTELGLHDLGGFGWTISVDAPDLLDRSVVYKRGFGGPILRPEVLAAADLPARAAALPGDTAQARLMAVDLGAATAELLRLAAIFAELDGQTWPPEGMGEHLETAQRIASALGPVVGSCLRAEDLWVSAEDEALMLGDLWIDIQDPTGLDAALQRVPDEVERLLEQGFAVKGKTFASRNRGDRLMILESGAEPTASRLGDTAGFKHGMAPFRDRLEQGGVVALDYAGPEFIALVVQRLRELGGDLDWETMKGVPRIDLLPGFDELVKLVGPSAGINLVRPDGLYSEYRSALGYSASNLIGSSADLMLGFGSWLEAVEQEAQASAVPQQDEDF
ncbi:MAG: hypothetical protein ISR76_05600 [Planctomycetes bacterium]|nr:hypothetical protein [Planctomycetota bacterium]